MFWLIETDVASRFFVAFVDAASSFSHINRFATQAFNIINTGILS
jgi:hypothetical protein